MEGYLIHAALMVAVIGTPVPKVEKHDPKDPKWKQLALKIIRRQEPGNEDWANDESVVSSVVSEDLGTREKITIEIHTMVMGNHDDVCVVTYYQQPQTTLPYKPDATCYCPVESTE